MTAEHVVVSTGAEPIIPDVPGLRDSAVVNTSTDLLATPDLPPRLVVLGGGYVGLEFAAMYAAYGSEVTVIEHHRQILGQEDDDIAASARDILRDVGITVITEAEVARGSRTGAGASEATVLLPARREHRIGAGRRHPGGDWPQAGDGGPRAGRGGDSARGRRRGGRRRTPPHQSAPRLRRRRRQRRPAVHLRLPRRLPDRARPTRRRGHAQHRTAGGRALHAVHDAAPVPGRTDRTRRARRRTSPQGRRAARGEDGDRGRGPASSTRPAE